MKLESKMQARLSVAFPEHWLPTGNKIIHWRTRNWIPDESQSDHSDQSDQLSAAVKKGEKQWISGLDLRETRAKNYSLDQDILEAASEPL